MSQKKKQSVKKELSRLLPGQFFDDAQTLHNHSTDASIFEVTPQYVIAPDNLQSLTKLVRKVDQLRQKGSRISLAARGGGTCLSGGSLTSSISVDISSKFAGIAHVDRENKVMTVGSGTSIKDIEKAAEAHVMQFAPAISFSANATIGGIISNNSMSEKSLHYGNASENLEGVYTVLADGNEYYFGPLNPVELEAKKAQDNFEGQLYRRLSGLLDRHHGLIERARPKIRHNVAGYNIWDIWDHDRTEFNIAKLLAGSQGTLGIITGARLNLVEKQKSSRMVSLPLTSLARMAEAIQLSLTAMPSSLEAYDKHILALARTQYHDDVAKIDKQVSGAEVVIFAEFTARDQRHADHLAHVYCELMSRSGFEAFYIKDKDQAAVHWKIRRASFALLQKNSSEQGRFLPFIEDVAINPAYFGEFIAALELILAEYDMKVAFAGHVGEGNVRFMPHINLESHATPQLIFGLEKRVNDLAYAFGGTMSCSHNDGLIRGPFLEQMYGEEICELFTRIKSIFDPHGIFNPGKKTNIDLEYSLQHIVRKNVPSSEVS